MFHNRLMMSCLLVAVAAGCGRAQRAPDNARINRKIEIQVRQQLDVPADWSMTVGARQKSDIPGFDNVPITFFSLSQPNKKQTIDFLLSTDGNTLARMSKWDISKDLTQVASTSGRPFRGNPAAKVTIVNFDDLECPFCAKMHAELFPETIDHYKGLIKIVYKDYPLVEIHPWAMRAAVDANCLAAQNGEAYWSYVDYLHTHGQDVSGPDRDPAKSAATLDKLAREQGQKSKLDVATLDACLKKQDDSVVQASMKEGEALGVDGTPTLFVNGERLSGALPVERVWMVIDRALKAEGITPPPAPGEGSPSQPTQPGQAK